MSLLLTHGYFLKEDERELKIMKPYPPLGLQYISAYLTQNGIVHDVFDTTFATMRDFENHICGLMPSVVGIYVNLMTRSNVVKMIDFIRSRKQLKDCTLILGGPEVRHYRENFLRAGADILVMGEGEETMLELMESGGALTLEKLERISGLAFLDRDGSVRLSPPRGMITDIDNLPFPARDRIPYQNYFDAWRKAHGYAAITVSTMRGCPYGCKWCSRAVYGKSYRRRSPANVFEEIRTLQNTYQFDRIWFVDDVFTINRKWMREFAALAKENKPLISYEAITRADRMDDEIVGLLAESGCFRIWIGAESGSQDILDAMNRMVKIEKVTEMVKLSMQNGIEAGTFIMLGYPGEREGDIRKTLRYLMAARPDHYTITLAYPIKGTPFFEEVEESLFMHLPWESSSDRDIEFNRTYSRRYYDHAIQWINSEMKRVQSKGLVKWMHRGQSAKARTGMLLQRLFSGKNSQEA